ncbi:MAG: hypothetical protein PVJ57_07105 [Phycisphaerae bacterium]
MPTAGFVTKRRRLAAAIGLAVLFAGSVAIAQTTQPASVPAGIPFANATFGFEMMLPPGWVYDRGIFAGPQGALGLLRGESQGARQAMQILVFRRGEMPPFGDWVRVFEEELTELHKPHPLRHAEWKGLDRPAVLLTVDPVVAGRRTITRYLCVSFDPNTVWVLVVAGGVDEEAEAEALESFFKTLAATVHVSYDANDVQAVAAALKRGMAVLEELRSGAAGVEVDPAEHYYEMTIDGQPEGYMMRWMRRESQGLDDPRFDDRHKEGLRVHEESWSFAEDGTVRNSELNLFSSLDLRSELIENRLTQVPAPDVQSQRLYIELDQCVREDTVLFSSFSTNLTLALPEPRRPLPVGQAYLDLAWARCLPRLLLKAPTESYAFWIYDTRTRALTIHRIQQRGPGLVPGGSGRPGYVFEVREGFAAEPSLVYTDARGQVVRMEIGGLVLTATDREQIDRRYGERREAARQRMIPAATRQPAP